MQIQIIVITFFALSLSLEGLSQETEKSDSLSSGEISVQKDTTSNLIAEDSSATSRKSPKRHSVKRAVAQSALVPGLGQIYNKKWWKVPIIYAGFGGLGFAIGWNTKEFRIYSDAYRARVDGDPATVDQFENTYSESNLLTLKNYYKRNMNVAIIFTAVLYALNIADAAVDAHLFEYDISDDLTLMAEPMMQFSGSRDGSFTGLNLTMRF